MDRHHVSTGRSSSNCDSVDRHFVAHPRKHGTRQDYQREQAFSRSTPTQIDLRDLRLAECIDDNEPPLVQNPDSLYEPTQGDDIHPLPSKAHYLSQNDFFELFDYPENDRSQKQMKQDYLALSRRFNNKIKFKSLVGKNASSLSFCRLLPEIKPLIAVLPA